MEQSTAWKKHTNIYEVNVRQYTKEGTFAAFSKELPRLKKMGIEVLWFMPITPIATEKRKGTLGSPYACSSYTKINPEFGTLEDFKNIVNQAQEMGFKVIIDWVANHTGWNHEWTITHPEYYLHNEDGSFHAASGMDDIIELDYKNPDLRKAMITAMKYWVKECNIDGFRCDLATWVELDFWEEAKPEIDETKTLIWLGEYDELDAPEYGKVFDISYSWLWMHKTEEYYKNNLPLSTLKDLLIRYSSVGDRSMRAWFTSNHDENSWNGSEYEKYGVIAKPLAVFSATWNGVPLLYSGQEMANKKRLEFFDKDTIDWNGTYELEEFYKTLFDLKSTNSALKAGDPDGKTFFINTSANDKILAYSRKNAEDEVLVILNMSKESINFTIDDAEVSGTFNELFSHKNRDFSKDNVFDIPVSGYEVYVK